LAHNGYINNRLVGHLLKEASGAILFRYDESWLSWSNVEKQLPRGFPKDIHRSVKAGLTARLKNI